MLKGMPLVAAAFLLLGCSQPNESASGVSAPNTNPVGDIMAQAAQSQVDSISVQVAKDAEAQYEIAKRQGDKMQICVQAGMVSAAHLQAKDEANYSKWKDIQDVDCQAAGLPKM